MGALDFDPLDYELKAIRKFASQDTTRTNMCRVYTYRTEDGCTSVATNGHCLVVRRSGTHREMSVHDIAKLPHDQGDERPPPWNVVLNPPVRATNAPQYDNRSIDPTYFSWLADLEKVAGRRASEDYTPPSYESAKTTAKHRQNLKKGACSRIAIPSDPLDGWHFYITTDAVSWRGMIMPRRP